jgi:ubiquinone/menaquinone biosynthesis C-methylase UbiE
MNDIELNHVRGAYSIIAENFSETRNKPWDWIIDFYKDLAITKPNANILDHGCGGGRNMVNIDLEDNTKTEFTFQGIDVCPEFVEISKRKGCTAIKGDMCDMPFENESFDAIVSIASYHHLYTDDRRTQAMNEIYRVMKPGAKGLMSVWSINQPECSKNYGKFKYGDNMIPWLDRKKNLICNRYYYIFKKDELESLFNNNNLTIINWTWQYGNELIYFEK